jgi:hypothetical protein
MVGKTYVRLPQKPRKARARQQNVIRRTRRGVGPRQPHRLSQGLIHHPNNSITHVNFYTSSKQHISKHTVPLVPFLELQLPSLLFVGASGEEFVFAPGLGELLVAADWVVEGFFRVSFVVVVVVVRGMVGEQGLNFRVFGAERVLARGDFG